MSLLRRRQDEQRMKRVARNKAEHILSDVTPRDVGKWYSVHGALCSCPMCRNPRRNGIKTRSEKRADERDKFDQLDY